MENKYKALEHLLEAIKCSREEVKNLELIDNESHVLITWSGGYKQTVNVRGDSICAMIRDVMRNIGV